MTTKTKATASRQSYAKNVGIGSFIAASVFLFNPCINVVDLLPDFFGYLLLIKALTKWADLCPNIADAMIGLKKLRWFMLIKLFSVLLVPFVDDLHVLTLTFGFFIIECIFLIPALERIFDGFEYFGTRFSGHAVFVNLKNIRTLTYILFIGKGLLCLVPELCSLSNFEHLGYVTANAIDFARFKPLLTVLHLVLSLPIGILWLVNIIPYFKRIGRETDFIGRVLHDYDLEITNNFGLNVRRAFRSIFSLCIAGFAFIPNLWIDEINIIPTFIGAFILTIAMIKLRKFSPKASKFSTIASAVFFVISLASYIVSLIFSANYGIKAVKLDFGAYEFFGITRILSVIEYASMAVAMFLVIREMRALIREYLGGKTVVTDKRLIELYSADQRKADDQMFICFIGFLVIAVLSVVYIILRADINIAFWIIPFLAALFWTVYTASTINNIYDSIEYKYL